jgi:hypothetical protein
MKLQEQYAVTEGFKELRDVLSALMDKHALGLVYEGENVSGVPHARTLVESLWEEIDAQFGTSEKPKKVETSSR